MVASIRRAYGRAPSTGFKVAIAAGGLIAVLFLFGLLTVGKMVARSIGLTSPEVETTTQTATMPPAAAPTTAKTRDPVVVPLDAAPGSP